MTINSCKKVSIRFNLYCDLRTKNNPQLEATYIFTHTQYLVRKNRDEIN